MEQQQNAGSNLNKRKPKNPIKFNITLNEEQKQAKQQILHNTVTLLKGAAGSGKTLLACQIALDMFFKRQINKIIITRPTVSNEDNGFLPGSLSEKMEPWLVPLRSNMRKVYNKPEILEKMEREENIELVSLAHFRGRTFDHAVCIVDEFQNLTKQQVQDIIHFVDLEQSRRDRRNNKIQSSQIDVPGEGKIIMTKVK